MQGQNEDMSFPGVDNTSLELYNKGEWKQLDDLADESLSKGIDYYYLRIRAGIACFELEKYLKATRHLQKALEYNQGDPLAGEYLFGCYLRLNKPQDAAALWETFPPSLQKKLRPDLPRLHEVSVEAGPLFSNQEEQFNLIDLDGEDNIYGEADITQDGYYFDAGLSWSFKKGISLFGGYSLVKLNKNKVVEIGDSLSVDDLYPLKQHQFYLSGRIPITENLFLQPAINYVMDDYTTVMPELSNDSMNYLFPVESFRLHSFIGYLSVTKDFNILQTGIFGAYSNLNDLNQYQGGFKATILPLGNLDLYFTSRLLGNFNESDLDIIFEQIAGARLFQTLWAEMNATFGRMENYHDRDAFVVYNIADVLKFKGGAKLIFVPSPRWTLSAEYIYFLRDGEYIYYSLDESENAFSVTAHRDFNTQVVIVGLKWKF